MSKIEHDCVLVKKEILNSENLFLTFESQEIAEQAQPGQFIDLKGAAFLRRPFGIASVNRDRGQFGIGIKKKSAGTAYFFEAKLGNIYSVLGPLGNGFNFEGLKNIFLIGGGTGIYPLLFVLEKAKEIGIKTYIATGFRSQEDILLEEEMGRIATELCIATEDGSAHLKGYAQQALEKLWSEHGEAKPDTGLFCCGPQPMMKMAAVWAESLNLQCQVSTEERMACGIGICRTCAVRVKDLISGELNYDRCCLEGPVFNAEVIQW
ncbi:MAG: dihydroorotate dehydrogenase electron transfer subunit [Clostridiaceae bacterium]|jgi:dihydroorotate dehydrogenase electron transfer subunit|nr:dihydroorotate dehydrogenase electron transfer subunit [Bacillota bacterium]NLN52081.1 dihydroorotate dehydrogenase electron transfer subunit [Clostridiaceae bacterium]